MRRELEVAVALPGSGHARTVFAADPTTWLPDPARAAGRDRWRVTLAAGPVHRDVIAGIGSLWVEGEVLSRSIGWSPAPVPHAQHHRDVLPRFRGDLVLEVVDGANRLRLAGSYVPPGGVVGGVMDQALLHGIAHATAHGFLAVVRERLSEPRRRDRRSRQRRDVRRPGQGRSPLGSAGPLADHGGDAGNAASRPPT